LRSGLKLPKLGFVMRVEIEGGDVIPGKRKKQCRRGNQLARARDPDPVHLKELQLKMVLTDAATISHQTELLLTFWSTTVAVRCASSRMSTIHGFASLYIVMNPRNAWTKNYFFNNSFFVKLSLPLLNMSPEIKYKKKVEETCFCI